MNKKELDAERMVNDILIDQLEASTNFFKGTIKNIKYLVKTANSIDTNLIQLENETEQFKSLVQSIKKIIPLIIGSNKKAFKDGSPQHFLRSFYDLCNDANSSLKNIMRRINRLRGSNRLTIYQLSRILALSRNVYLLIVELKKFNILSKTNEIAEIDRDRVLKLIEFFDNQSGILVQHIRNFKRVFDTLKNAV